MKIKFHRNREDNLVCDDSYPKIRIAGRGFLRIRSKKKGTFVTKDGRTFKTIHIGLANPNWRMAVIHEIAHVLLCKYDNSERYTSDRYYALRLEVLTERLAKSFCKPEYWDDYDSKATLCGFAQNEKKNGSEEWRHIDINKLKIIPINNGIRVS